jgi:hypothetical protein
MKKLIFLVLIALCNAEGQNLSDTQLDSLYNLFLRLHNIPAVPQPDHPSEIFPSKCGLGIINQVKFNIERYPPDKQQILKSYFARPVRQTSMVSPSGRFRIHYNDSESGIPRYNPALSTAENVTEVGRALDSSYNFQVGFLGYPPPPPDTGGSDNLYDVYIVDFGGSVYGYTETEDHLGQGKYTSYMVIDNDYSGYYSSGLDGMRVTVAHELHHAIQIGNYIFRDSDIFFYEITSTAMEEFVFDSINDYYAYMHDYFMNPGRALAANNGYNLAIWNIFLRDMFGYDILKRQWEMMPNSRALTAIQNSLQEVSSSFRDAYNEFGIWTFFTGPRSVPGSFFSEGAAYPLIQYTSTIQFNPSSTPVQVNLKATSNKFIAFVNSSLVPADTFAAIITNGDYFNGIDNFQQDFGFEYILSGDSLPGSTKLTDRYFAKINVENPGLWSVSEILNNHILRKGGIITPPVESDEIFVYPNPFYYNRMHNHITIVLGEGNETEYDFNVYTSGMELVFADVLTASNKILRWDIRDNKELASGVYIFAVRGGNKTYLGKLVIFNE